MTCMEVETRLDDYVDGLLAEPELKEIELHLGGCPTCREQERRLRAILAQAAALRAGLAPPRDLWPAIADRIGGVERRASRGVWVGLAAAAVLVIAMTYNLSHRASSTVPATTLTPAAYQGGDNLPELEADYARATAALLAALRERPGSVSAETLDSVQKNLDVIDGALAEVREALRKDPHNGELAHMLVATHRKKVDVLQQVVKLSTPL